MPDTHTKTAPKAKAPGEDEGRPSDRSWLSFTSRRNRPATVFPGADHKLPEASALADKGLAGPNPAKASTRATGVLPPASPFLPSPASPSAASTASDTLSSPKMEASESPRTGVEPDAWEAVPEDIMEDIEYSDLTRALEGKAAMPQAQAPDLDTRDPIQGTIAGMPSVVRRTMDFLGFRRSQEVAVADAMAGGQVPSVEVAAVEGVLLWNEPWLTAKVLSLGLYILICLRQLVSGVEILQPSTGLAGLALAVLAWNAGRHMLHRQQARAQGDSVAQADAGMSQAELLHMQQRITEQMVYASQAVAPYMAAVIGTAARHLSGRGSLGSTAWLGLALWAIILIGQVQLVQQSTLALLCWASLFCLPLLYLQCRRALDTLVEESLFFVSQAVMGGQRATMGFSAGAALLTMAVLNTSWVLRVSCAAVSGFAVLVWCSRRKRLSCTFRH
ncbi:hypothetical protein WJX74_003281 [Apatococcus lobatus]|uniref:Reticulon-like protein n=1 Tax=Apatococcus lobatus TaxID=904363 RepID=A0AAW1RHA9_9CHLO